MAAHGGHTRASGGRTVKMNVPVPLPLGTSHGEQCTPRFVRSFLVRVGSLYTSESQNYPISDNLQARGPNRAPRTSLRHRPPDHRPRIPFSTRMPKRNRKGPKARHLGGSNPSSLEHRPRLGHQSGPEHVTSALDVCSVRCPQGPDGPAAAASSLSLHRLLWTAEVWQG